MIASLTGTLKLISKSEIVLEVNGVGYLLNVSSKLIASIGEIGSKLSRKDCSREVIKKEKAHTQSLNYAVARIYFFKMHKYNFMP